MVFFKSGDDRFEQGNEFIKRKEYDKARAAFEKAISKGAADARIAKVMISLLNLRSPSAAAYGEAVKLLREEGELEIAFGLFTIKCSQLQTECDAALSELMSLGLPQSGAPALKTRAEKLFEAAMKYQTQIGMNTLIIPEVYTAARITGIQKANGLMAEGNENMAESVAWEDPKRAAEFLQMALNYRQQMGDGNAEARIRDKISQYAKAAACWICGREATGETLHFVSMPTEVTAMQSRSRSSSPLPSSPDGMSIYVCRACYLAISKRADAIAKQYHDSTMRELQAMEARINARMSSISSRLR